MTEVEPPPIAIAGLRQVATPVSINPRWLRDTRILAAALFCLALFSAAPGLWDLVGHLQAIHSRGVARWACGLLALGGIEAAYALYLLHLPDWSTVRVTTFLSLLIVMLLAIFLGLAVMTSEQNGFIQWLDLNDRLRESRFWTFCVLSLTSTWSYFSGRTAVRWRRAETA